MNSKSSILSHKEKKIQARQFSNYLQSACPKNDRAIKKNVFLLLDFQNSVLVVDAFFI